MVTGACLIAAAAGMIAVSPASASDSRPLALALLASPTPLPTETATATTVPTASQTGLPGSGSTENLPVDQGTVTETPVPPSPTPAGTPTPEPVPPDGVARQAFVPIMMYHYLSTPPADADIYRLDLSVTPEVFREQLQWLADNGYATISLYDLIGYLNVGYPPLPEKPIVLTFDDGYLDNYTNAFPLLQEYGYTATFFILTDVTNRQDPNYMTWDMYREMHNAGMDIEVHGREHHDMAGKDAAWLEATLVGAREAIASELGYTPYLLCYPAGSYDENVLDAARQHGYWAAVTTQHGALHDKAAPFELRRVRVRGDWTLATFSAVVEGFTAQ